MKYLRYATYAITWLYSLDRRICSDKCSTNPFFTTLFFYVFMLVGNLNASGFVVDDDLGLLDAIVTQMPTQTIGIGILVYLIVLVESVALCGSFENVFMRTVIVTTIGFAAYVFGVACPIPANIVLLLALVAYALSGVYYIAERCRR